MQPYLEPAVYVNSLGGPDDGDRVREAFGGNYGRLAAIKKAWRTTYGGYSGPELKLVDPRSAAFRKLSLDYRRWSAIVVASDSSCGGCDGEYRSGAHRSHPGSVGWIFDQWQREQWRIVAVRTVGGVWE